eukprot:XP_001692823.1 predicted protein [Chlamydomonas reinhardtii]
MEASPGPSSATGAAGTRTSGRARKPRGEFWMNADGNKSQSKLLLDFPELSERKQGTGTCAPKSQAAAPKSAAHKLRVSSADGTGVAAAVPTVPAAAAAAVIAPAVTSPRKKASAKELQMLGSINVIRFVVDEGEAGKRATRARGVAAPVPTGHAAAVTASTATAATGAVRQAVLNGGTATSKAAREPEARARVAVPAATAAAGAGGMGDCAAVVAVMGLGVDEDGGAPQGSPPAPDLQRTSARHGAGRGTAGAAAGGSSRAGSARGRSSSGKAKSAGGTVVGSGKQQGPSGSAPQPALGARPAAAAAPAPAVQPEADQDEEAARPRKRSRKGGRTDVTHAAAPMPQPAPQPAVAASTGAGAAGVAPHAAEGPSRSLSRRSGRAAGPSVATASVQPPPATADRPVSMVAATATTATVMTAGAGGDDAGQGMAGDAGGSKARSERDGKGSKGTKRRRGQNGSVATNASAEGAAAATASQQVQQQGSQQLGKEVSQLPPPQELRQGRQERPAASEAGTDSAATKNRVKAGSKGKEMAAEEKQAVTAADISKRAEAPPCVPAECSLEQQLQAQPQAQPEAVGEDGLAAAAADGHTGADEADGGWSGAMQAALVAASAAASAAKAAAAVCGARSVSPTASVAQSSAGEDAWQRRGSGAPRHTVAVGTAASGAGGWVGGVDMPDRMPGRERPPQQQLYRTALEDQGAADGEDGHSNRQSLAAPGQGQGQGQRVSYPPLQQRGAQQRQTDQQQQLLSDSRRSSHAHAGGSWQPAAHAAAGGVAGDAYWDAPGGRERVGDRAFSDRQLPMGALYGAGYGTAAAEPMEEDRDDGGHARGYPPSMSTRLQPRQHEEEQRRQQHGQAHSQPLPQHPPAFAIPTLRGRAHHQQHSQQQHSQPQQEARPAMSSGAATSTVASVFSDSLRRALSRADQLAQRNKTRHQEIAENEEDGWTLEQVQSLQSAYYRVDPLHPHFWREVARGVPGKTAAPD